ncbi:hypothetical protein VQL36_15935 [Chengkuizengella sp. SCS-71B]|uniref:hypothetical protein n=1 Tax=Chengkuizengella sp. SCS-71B TaxID=3115290 RepID=UPI0032C231E3
MIFQRLGIPPDEVYDKPIGARRFMFASMLLQLEEEEKEVKRLQRSRMNRS